MKTSLLEQELIDVVSALDGFDDRVFSVYNMDELEEKASISGFPIVAIGFERAVPSPGNQGVTAEGRTKTGSDDRMLVNKRFTIVVGVDYNWNGEGESGSRAVATDLLDDIRRALLGYVGVNKGRPWRFVGEGPTDTALASVIFYAQTWETTTLITGGNA